MAISARVPCVLLLVAAACRTAAPPPPPAPPAPEPVAAEPAPAAEHPVAATRRMEEELERVVVAEPTGEAREDAVLELYFESGAAELTAEARAVLAGACDRLFTGDSDYHLEVQGHADASGSPTANLRLAERRAEVVRDYLHREQGVPLDRMEVVPLGARAPAAENLTPEGRELNRRVVVVVVREPSPPPP
jgi:outer membrane protein OmpA-like peptidoglycan-associated protein